MTRTCLGRSIGIGLCLIMMGLTLIQADELKEVNYYARNHAWLNFWTDWNSGTKTEMDADLDTIVALGANTVRIFLHTDVFGYPQPTQTYVGYLDEALDLIAQHGLKAHVTLFDCGSNPADIIGSKTWVDAIVTENDARVVVWELQNEVDLSNATVASWVAELLPYLDLHTGNTPVTVSVLNVEFLDDLPTTSNLIYSLHWYPSNAYRWTSEFPQVIERALQLVAPSKLLLGELGYHTCEEFSETSQANLYRDVFYSAAHKGITNLGIWTLSDFPESTLICGKTPPERERFFGIYKNDGAPKPAATIVNNAFHGTPPPNPSPIEILNSSFEWLNSCGNLENWKGWDQNWSEQQMMIRDCTSAHSGICSVKIQGPGNLIVGMGTIPAFLVTQNSTYDLRGYVKTENLIGWAKLVFSWYDSNVQWISNTDSAFITTPNASWTELRINNASPPVGAMYLQVYGMMYSTNPLSSVWFDDLALTITPNSYLLWTK